MLASEYLTVSHIPTRDLVRIFSKIQINNGTDCWVWKRSVNTDGYGRVAWKYAGGCGIQSIHRLIYAWLVSPVPKGLARHIPQIDHTCRNRRCCNPLHLELKTPKANVLESRAGSAINAQKTHCPKGHPYNEVNTYIQKKGGRVCKTCHNDYTRELQRRKRAKARAYATRKSRTAAAEVLDIEDAA